MAAILTWTQCVKPCYKETQCTVNLWYTVHPMTYTYSLDFDVLGCSLALIDSTLVLQGNFTGSVAILWLIVMKCIPQQKPNLFKVNTFVLSFKDIISCINTGSLNNVIHKSQTIYTWFYYTYHTLILLDSSNPFTHSHLCFFTGTTAIIWLPRYVPKKKTTRIQVKSFDIKSQHKTWAIPVNL